MATQTFATRSTDKISSYERQSAQDSQDESTERTLREAVKASKRARDIVRSAERFLGNE